MRPSKRTTILDAALEVIERRGIGAVSYESVAEAAELTKGGIQYHFATREELLHALQQHLADRWEAVLVRAAGKSAADATPAERLAAYARSVGASATNAELLMAAETIDHPELREVWDRVIERWTPAVPEGRIPAATLTALVVRLAADGLWAHDLLSGAPLPPAARQQIAEHLASMATTASPRE